MCNILLCSTSLYMYMLIFLCIAQNCFVFKNKCHNAILGVSLYIHEQCIGKVVMYLAAATPTYTF